jgi:hypothetical protein
VEIGTAQFVVALFESEAAADAAAEALIDWDEANNDINACAIGVLVRDSDGDVSDHKFDVRTGARSTRIGAVLGLAVALPEAGNGISAEVAAGVMAGSIASALFCRALQLSRDGGGCAARDTGGGSAVVGVLVPAERVSAVAEKLVELGGTPETHEADGRRD